MYRVFFFRGPPPHNEVSNLRTTFLPFLGSRCGSAEEWWENNENQRIPCLLLSQANLKLIFFIAIFFKNIYKMKTLSPDLAPILPNTNFSNKTHLWDFLTNMYVKNESYLIFMNLCKPKLAYFTSILQNMGSKWLQKTCRTKLPKLIKSNKNAKCAS
jgi:hypothetical protein